MFQAITTHILLPLAGRVGTSLATLLVGYGVTVDHANLAANAVTAVALVVADLLGGYLNRKAAAQRAVAKSLSLMLPVPDLPEDALSVRFGELLAKVGKADKP